MARRFELLVAAASRPRFFPAVSSSLPLAAGFAAAGAFAAFAAFATFVVTLAMRQVPFFCLARLSTSTVSSSWYRTLCLPPFASAVIVAPYHMPSSGHRSSIVVPTLSALSVDLALTVAFGSCCFAAFVKVDDRMSSSSRSSTSPFTLPEV